ncbi:sugar phosphate isomerase/epimerase, partial [Ruminococcaceae bacterium OttesenSCG-928-A11]|nr:sugar phosphate isomerase/epimerase [Ruminococcaceae bacterium OttesenSCG-928-A11]
MAVVRDLGLGYVEASADNECDPLYTGGDYLADWARKVRAAAAQTGVTVSQFFSGHGTYATLGLCHPDERVRRRMLDDWLRPMCRLAGDFGANLGFFAHGISLATLEQPARYRQK